MESVSGLVPRLISNVTRAIDAHESCESLNPSYSNRVDDPDSYNYCPVPNSGQDAIIYAALALVATCLLQGRLSALWVFIAGGLLQLLNTACNMGPLSNGATLWLGIEPADIFLYVFLPPLLLDATVRTDYFTFKKVMIPVLTYAFLVVVSSTLMMIPLMLYGLDLRSLGWRWQHAAVFTSMISSTDAVAVSAILHSGGASASMTALLEGESLFNDATSITLFEIFLQLVRDLEKGVPELSMLDTSITVTTRILHLSIGGFIIGYAFGIVTRSLLKLMQRFGSTPPQELSLTLGMAYMAFFVANSPQIAGTSGVISVVAMGIYGSATGKWDMSPRVAMGNVFYSFWDSIGFIINGVVFFFAGSSAVNFFVRSSRELEEDGAVQALFETFWRMPLVYVAMFLVRGLSIAMFKPLFDLVGQGMSWGVVGFTTLVGLRGAVSLILAQILVLDQERKLLSNRRITAEMALWTAGFVVLTLAVNAPLVPWLLRVTGVAESSSIKRRMRSKAARALVHYTQSAIDDLKQDEDEMLRGVDWSMVAHYVDISGALPAYQPDADSGSGSDDDGDGGTAQSHELSQSNSPHNWSERVGIAQATAWTKQRMGNMLGRRRSSGDQLPRWADDAEVEGDGREAEWQGFMAPLLNRAHQDSTIVEAYVDGSVHSIVTEGGGGRVPRRTVEEAGPNGTGTSVAQPWPNDLATLEEAHGRCADDLPFMGTDMSGMKRSPSVDERAGLPRHSGLSQDRAPASDAACGGEGGIAEAADALPAKDPTSSASLKSSRMPSGDVTDDPIINPQTGNWEKDPAAARAAGGSVGGPENRSGEGNDRYTVLPQPMLVPGLRSARSGGGSGSPIPTVSWMAVDVRALKHGASGQTPPDDWKRPPTPTRFGSSHQSSFGGSSADEGGDIEEGCGRPLVDGRPSRRGLLSGGLSSLSEGRTDGSMHRSLGRSPTANTGDADPSQSRQTSSPSARDSSTQQAFYAFNTHEPGIAVPDAPGSASSPVQDIADEHAKELTTEARLRLLSGLKRYFHQKRAEGLLSGRGMIILDYACDNAMDAAEQPLDVWTTIETEVAGGRRVKILAWLLFQLSVLGNWLRDTNVPLVRYLLWLPRRAAASWLNAQLSSVMLVGIESAVQYWLALSWSPQAQWLRYSDPSGCLLDEVAEQSKSVWKFIIEREIEAPDRFQAIQSYRAAMAILRQQARFIEQLYESGMVDEKEKEELTEPVEARERTLSRLGAVWRSPLLLDILKGLPFFANASNALFDRVLAAGQLIMYTAGDVVWHPPPSANKHAENSEGSCNGNISYGGLADTGSGKENGSQGVFVVLHGIVRSAYVAADGTASEYFLGRGGIFGLLPALVGESLPGARAVVAEGNLLRRGPVVFRLPPEAIEAIQDDADKGDVACDQLMLDMYRVASLYMAERMRNEVVATVAAHYQHLRLTTARRAIAKEARNLATKAVHDAERAKSRAGKDKAGKEKVRPLEGSTLDRCRTFLESEFGEVVSAIRKDGGKGAKKPKGYKPPNSPASMGGASSPYGAAANTAAQGDPRRPSDGGAAGSGLARAAAAALAAANEGSTHNSSGHDRPADYRSEGGPFEAGSTLGTDWSAVGAVPTDEELLAEMDPNVMWRDIQYHAGQVLATLKDGLREAEILELPAGAVVKQRSSLVVLRGTLRVSGFAEEPPAPPAHSGGTHKSGSNGKGSGSGGGKGRGRKALVVYRAPCILPWLWDIAAPAAGLIPAPVHLLAGSGGAIVAKCPSEEDETTTTSSEASHSLPDENALSDSISITDAAAGDAAGLRSDSKSSSFQSVDSAFIRSCSIVAADEEASGQKMVVPSGGNGDGGGSSSSKTARSGGDGGVPSSSKLLRSCSKKTSFVADSSDHGSSIQGDPAAKSAAGPAPKTPQPLRRRASMQRLPSLAIAGNDAGELSSYASGTGKSSSERMQVVHLQRSRSVARMAATAVLEEDESEDALSD